MSRLHAIVRGRVQMVGFRYFVETEAKKLGLTGWVRNGVDGSTMEVVAEGKEDQLRQLEAKLHQGPRLARVERVDVTWAKDVVGYDRFDVRF
jgi:acylphosphatase